MNDLISRQRLLMIIKPMVGMFTDEGFYVEYDAVIRAIENAPQADLHEEATDYPVKYISPGLEQQYYHDLLPLIEPGMAARMLKHKILECPGARIDYLGAEAVISQVPTVDAVPVRHEKWLDAGEDDEIRIRGVTRKYMICTGCGQMSLVPAIKEKILYDHCPKCGARMDQDWRDKHGAERSEDGET